MPANLFLTIILNMSYLGNRDPIYPRNSTPIIIKLIKIKLIYIILACLNPERAINFSLKENYIAASFEWAIKPKVQCHVPIHSKLKNPNWSAFSDKIEESQWLHLVCQISADNTEFCSITGIWFDFLCGSINKNDLIIIYQRLA